MGINAPVSALVMATLPVFLGIWTQGTPKPMRIAGFVLAAVSIVLVSRPQKLHGSPRGLGLAVLAGVGFGVFLVSMQRAGMAHVFWPLAAARLSSVITIGSIVLALREQAGAVGGWRLILIAGVLDMSGNAFFMLATRHGRLDVAAALSSLYPVTTVLLAYLVNREHVHWVQGVGSVLAMVAVPMIAT